MYIYNVCTTGELQKLAPHPPTVHTHTHTHMHISPHPHQCSSHTHTHLPPPSHCSHPHTSAPTHPLFTPTHISPHPHLHQCSSHNLYSGSTVGGALDTLCISLALRIALSYASCACSNSPCDSLATAMAVSGKRHRSVHSPTKRSSQFRLE